MSLGSDEPEESLFDIAANPEVIFDISKRSMLLGKVTGTHIAYEEYSILGYEGIRI